MVYYYESFRPSTSYSEASRSRSYSVNRYSSPTRHNYGSSSRASSQISSYGAPSLRTLLQENIESPYSSRSSSLSSTGTHSSAASYLRNLQQETNDSPYSSRSSPGTNSSAASYLRNLQQETNEYPYSSRRSSLSSTCTSTSSRGSSFSKDSPAPAAQQHFQLCDISRESDITSSVIRDRNTLGFKSTQRFNREKEASIPRSSFEDTINSRIKLSSRGKFDVPSASSDACRQRNARSAYLSALDDTSFTMKSRDTM